MMATFCKTREERRSAGARVILRGSWRSLTVICLAWGITADACTTAVISGRATADGRPILWKNRDAPATHNEVVLFTEAGLRAVAVVNAGSRNSIWMGVNEAGFCIENSLSTDLKSEGKPTGLSNGPFMKRALLECRTVEDFRKLLSETNSTGRRTTANIGVIDAHGGAALFEVRPTSFVMFDANDPAVAPDGFIVRSNFATTAHQLSPCPPAESLQEIDSGERYLRAETLLARAGSGNIELPFVLRNMARDLADPAGRPYPGTVNSAAGELPLTIPTGRTISRATSVSAAVFRGVRRDEDPRLTTMWTVLGDPKFSVAVPCWASMTEVADPLTDERGGELGEIARTLRDASIHSGSKTISTKLLPGIWTDLWPLEDRLLGETSQLLDQLSDGAVQRETDDSGAVTPEARRDQSEVATDTDADVLPLRLTEMHLRLATEAMRGMNRELLEAKQAVLARDPSPVTPRLSKSTAQRVRVGIYDHSDGTAHGPRHLAQILTPEFGFSCSVLTPEQIRDDALHAVDVLIMPGGSGSSQSRHLEDEGRLAVQRFVRNGGGYVGICAGAYLASSHYSWSLGLIDAHVWDRAHWARGTGKVTLKLDDSAVIALSAEGEEVDVFYGQGPLLVPGGDKGRRPYEVLATYQTEIVSKGAAPRSMTETHAIIRSWFGDGRVILFSPHPEKPGGPHSLIRSGVRWAAHPGSTKQ